MMEQGNCMTGLIFSNLFLLYPLVFSVSVEAYKNYTVGDSLGWYDTLEKPEVNYQKWVAAKNFSLGDFLIFNTDSNHSVILTYNFTTYKRCDYYNALDNDTMQWSSADPSASSPQPVTVPVPLLKVGMTYFFSGDYDGEQCQNGQHFKIKVIYGQGLPPSLRDEFEQSPAPDSPQAGDDESAPDTIVPSSFDNPHDISDDQENNDHSESVSLKVLFKQSGGQFNGILILVGLVCIF